METPLIARTDRGLYCAAGDFHIDPWNSVPRAVLTHAHADHARPGCGKYLAAEMGYRLLRLRLGDDADIKTVPYGEAIDHNGVRVSFHPAGHVLGSSQVRVEHRGEIWVVSGDYKLDADPTCLPFEPVRCHTFITESTFGLPVYRWPPSTDIFDEVNEWWRRNRAIEKTSILYAYSLGKAQRVMAGVDSTIGSILTHGAVENVTRAYRQAGVVLPPTRPVVEAAREKVKPWLGGLVLAPPWAAGSPWLRKFAPFSAGVVSGWMRVRGARRRRAVDRGFALSDHVDWPGLLTAIAATGAQRVLATHGFASVLARHLREHGTEAEAISTSFNDEDEGDLAEGAPP